MKCTNTNCVNGYVEKGTGLELCPECNKLEDENIGTIVYPTQITPEMMKLARPMDDGSNDFFHWAANLNAMLHYGYCRKCHMVPDGCKREGCRAIQSMNS